jgi:hypothetical protein
MILDLHQFLWYKGDGVVVVVELNGEWLDGSGSSVLDQIRAEELNLTI